MSVCEQLVEREKVRAVVSVNEWYEIQFFTNTKKVSHHHTTSKHTTQYNDSYSTFCPMYIIMVCVSRALCRKVAKANIFIVVSSPFLLHVYKICPVFTVHKIYLSVVNFVCSSRR